MPIVYCDIETFSEISLKEHGAKVYAAHKSTGVHFLCWAIDNGEVQTWRPGDPVPEPFANPTGYKFVSDNWEFEHAIHASILVTRYGFPFAADRATGLRPALSIGKRLSGRAWFALRSAWSALLQEPGGAEGNAASVPAADRKEA